MVTAVDHFSAVLEAKKSITLEGLQYEVNQISKFTVKKVLKQSDALHHICTKKGVTIEIIEYLLSMSPDIRLNDTSTRFGDVQSWRNRNEIVSMTYPLHLACANKNCPNSVIELLLNKHPELCSEMSIISKSSYNKITDYLDEGDDMWGMPISFYLSRSSNVESDIVQKLVAAYPESLMYGCPDMNISPLHTILMNFHISNMYEVATYIIESSPDSVRMLDKRNFTPLHSALTCYSNNLDVRLVDLMLEKWPEITRQRDTRPCDYPIHVLCWGGEAVCFPSSREVLSEEKAFAILTKLIKADPSSVELRGMADEYLPIHLAVHSPLPFLKAIVEAFPEGLKVRCEGDLPLHRAQRREIKIIRYLFDQWPEAIEETPDIIREVEQSLNNAGKEETLSFLRNQRTYVREAKRNIRFDIQDGDGRLALHRALIQRNASLGSVKLLVQRNPAALQIVDNNGSLPLHYACKCQADIVQYLVEPYDGSLNTLDANGNSTLHCACIGGACDVVSYLMQKQNSFVSVRNRDGKIPFQLLTESNVSQSTDFVEATWLLLVAHPESIMQW